MKTKKITYIAMFSALLAVLSVVSIPTPSGVPFTLQTFAVAFCGFCLGKKYGTACVFIYLILGALGIPVFAGFSGGIENLFSITGGFLFGFIFLAFFCGMGRFLSLFGLFMCHLLGIIQFSLLTHTPFLASFLTVSLPYIFKDVVSIVFAYFVAKSLKKFIPF